MVKVSQISLFFFIHIFSQINHKPIYVRKNRNFEQVPTVGATSDGRQVFVAWYSGGPTPGPRNYVTVSLSLDSGKNWLNDQLVVYPKKQSDRFFDPVIWRDNLGKIHLFYGSSKDSLIWDGHGGVNALQINWNGKKIKASKPARLADGVMSNKPLYLPTKNKSLDISFSTNLEGAASSQWRATRRRSPSALSPPRSWSIPSPQSPLRASPKWRSWRG